MLEHKRAEIFHDSACWDVDDSQGSVAKSIPAAVHHVYW